MSKPAVVRNGVGSAAQTRTSKLAASESECGELNTSDGTDRWNGVMPSKAMMAIFMGVFDMARLYRMVTFRPLFAQAAQVDNGFIRTSTTRRIP